MLRKVICAALAEKRNVSQSYLRHRIEKKEGGAKSKPTSADKNYKITKLYLNNYNLELIQLVSRVLMLSCYETMEESVFRIK